MENKNTFTIEPYSAIASQNEQIVTFKYDGTVVINPKYTVDEAAKAFWDAVKNIAVQEGRTVKVGDA